MIASNLRRNVAGILTDFVGFGTALGFIGFDTLLPLLVFTLTGDKTLIGLVGTLWTGLWLLPQLAAGRWMAGRARKKPVLIWSAIVSRVALVLFVALLAFGHSVGPAPVFAGLLAVIVVFRGFDAVAAVAWFDLIGKVLPPDVRGRVFGSGQALSNVFRFGASLVVTAAIAGGLRYPDSYVMLYGLAVLCLGVSLAGLLVLREPAERNHALMSDQFGLVAHALHVVRQDVRFRQMVIARLLVGAFDLARPQYVVHATKVLGLPDSNIGLFIAAQTIGGIVASLLLGRLSARKGSVSVIQITTLLAAGGPLLALMLHLAGRTQPGLALAGYLLLFMLIGSIDASFLIGLLAYVLDIAPPGERTAYTGLANTIGGLTVIAPTIGGVLLQWSSYPVLFVCASLGGALALLTALKLPAALQSNAADA
ncbi:MAG TPA: MFS transporter [Anaerolineae bacterium]|nr:MFS transporter [Anaerolineae bacterium]